VLESDVTATVFPVERDCVRVNPAEPPGVEVVDLGKLGIAFAALPDTHALVFAFRGSVEGPLIDLKPPVDGVPLINAEKLGFG
jgi:hypothetical protein